MGDYLKIAVQKRDWNVARVLIENDIGLDDLYGNNYYSGHNENMTCLHLVVNADAPVDILQLILEKRPTFVHCKTVSGRAVISMVSNPSAMELLFQHGADPNVLCSYGWSVLYSHAFSGYRSDGHLKKSRKMVLMFMKYGADLYLKFTLSNTRDEWYNILEVFRRNIPFRKGADKVRMQTMYNLLVHTSVLMTLVQAYHHRVGACATTQILPRDVIRRLHTYLF